MQVDVTGTVSLCNKLIKLRDRLFFKKFPQKCSSKNSNIWALSNFKRPKLLENDALLDMGQLILSLLLTGEAMDQENPAGGATGGGLLFSPDGQEEFRDVGGESSICPTTFYFV